VEQTASLKLIAFIMNNNKSAPRRVHENAALCEQNTLSLTTARRARASERARDKKRFTACESKGEGPRQHQKISVRMCDQIELITLTCKRWKGSASWGDGGGVGAVHAAPNAGTTGGLIGLDPYSFLKLWRPQPPR
jgi:hypothetical protein